MSEKQQHAISPQREQDFPEWYQQVIKAADMAENSPVRGAMVIKPWGYGIWEKVQRQLDDRIKATGHENAYFPLFIPLRFFEKEAQHVQGFAKECAVVTHHRLEERDGRLVPVGELEEPMVVRPTSETIIGDAYAGWVESYRDLPILINQWANVVRWEMRTRLFLRTSEFLWQEGHTAHATEQEAMDETMKMLEVYRELAEDVLAMPVLVGEKSAGERFPGAERSFCIEAMMQDRKALQAGTSHFLGQNFAKASGIKFLDQNGDIRFAYTTSWGVSTRLIGGVIMTHSDDDGLRVPPRIAPKHAVILPVVPKPELEGQVMAYAERIALELAGVRYHELPLSVHIDRRDIRGGEKNWDWIKKGVPLRIEVGPRDMEGDSLVLYRRDKGVREKQFIKRAELPSMITSLLDEMQKGYFEEARARRDAQIYQHISTFDELKAFFTPKNQEKPEIHGGFVLAKWAGGIAEEKLLGEYKLSIRCIPLKQSGTSGNCVVTGQPATTDVIIGKSY